jgi:hypothetical protein
MDKDMRIFQIAKSAVLALAVAVVALALASPARAAEQSSYVIPIAGPHSMADLTTNYFNPAFRALASCSWGTSAPANGVGAAPGLYQSWCDTTTNPVVVKQYDGASWVVIGKLNTSTHVWTPSYQGTDTGTASVGTTGTSGHTIPYLDAANTWSAIQSGATAAVDTNTTQFATTAFVLAQAASATPLIDGSAAAGASTRYARGDHVHPTDTTRSPVASPTFTGTPAAPTAAVDTNTTQLATTAYVIGQASASGDGTPTMDGTAARGTGTHFARNDHIHPTDTSRAPLASPALTGTPTAPTAAPGTNTTQLATTAYADAIAALKVNLTRNVSTGCGLTGGGDLSADRTLKLSLLINAQVGTSYAVVDGDCSKLVTLSNASAVAVSLPQANGSTFVSGWSVDFQNRGAGLVTVTSVTSTINGGATIALAQNQGMHCQSDGANYSCMMGVGAGGGSGTVTNVATGDGLTGGPITSSGTLKADPVFHRGYLAGLTLSTAGASATFGIAAGVAVDSTNAGFMSLASAYTKTSAAWSVGTAVGALDTGSIAANTWYKVFEIKRPDTGVVDICITVNALASGCTTGGNIPAAYTLFRYIGSLKMNGVPQWIKFIQDGDVFQLDVPVNDVNATNPGAAAVTRALTVPTGIRVLADVFLNCLATAQTDSPGAVLLSDLSITDTAPASTVGGSVENFLGSTFSSMNTGGRVSVWTNTSAQVRSRLQLSGTGTTLIMVTHGWVDRRGRDS